MKEKKWKLKSLLSNFVVKGTNKWSNGKKGSRKEVFVCFLSKRNNDMFDDNNPIQGRGDML